MILSLKYSYTGIVITNKYCLSDNIYTKMGGGGVVTCNATRRVPILQELT